MADAVTLVRAASNTAKLADSVKAMWEERTKLRADANGQAWDLILRAQMDEVFLVLAHLGETILPLGVFNKDYYLQTLGDVKASLSSCGNEMLAAAWEDLDAELQYCCCAGLTLCAHFSPMPVYRGFGVCVLSDWDWGCPDMAYLEEKARKKAIRTVYGVKQKTDPQPTRSVFQDFDRVIQILQVKPMAFFVKRPPVSGFSEQPRFALRPKKEVKGDIDLLEDWMHQIVRRGHPSPPGQQITNWGFPFATWTSESNYYILKSEKDCETLMLNQMDPGRLLHAFLCKKVANLDEHSMFLLLPRSAAESLLCWLEGLPNQTHKVVRWDAFDTEMFEKKISKSLRKKIGQYPIPIKYAVRHPSASTRPEMHVSESSPAVLEHPNTVSPPPYSPTNVPSGAAAAVELPHRERAATVPVAELGVSDNQELHAESVESPIQTPQNAAKDRSSVLGKKSIHNLRRNPRGILSTAVASTTAIATATTRHPTVLRPGALKGRNSTSWMIEDRNGKTGEAETNVGNPTETSTDPTSEPVIAELPVEMALPDRPVRKPVPSVAVQSPADCAELPLTAIETEAQNTASDVPKPEPLVLNRATSTDAAATQSSQPSAPTSETNYLELLNKIARGEISLQALSEMLQNGSVGPSAPRAQPARPEEMVTSESVEEKGEKTPGRTLYPLPYPDGPGGAT